MEMPPITHHSRGDLLPLGARQTPKNSGLVFISNIITTCGTDAPADSLYQFSDSV